MNWLIYIELTFSNCVVSLSAPSPNATLMRPNIGGLVCGWLLQGSHHQGKSGKKIPSGKSGNVRECQYFLSRVRESQGKWSGLGGPKKKHTQKKNTQWLQVKTFSSLRSEFYAVHFRFCGVKSGKFRKNSSDMSGKVREFKSSWPLGTLRFLEIFPSWHNVLSFCVY